MPARRRSSVVCVRQGKLLLVKARDESVPCEYLFLPGGGIEEGESPAQAAVRETLEETGYRVAVDEETASVAEYDFTWQGRVVGSHTHFFKAWLIDPDEAPKEVHEDPFVLSVHWEPLHKLDQIVNYHPVILEHVKKHLPSA